MEHLHVNENNNNNVIKTVAYFQLVKILEFFQAVFDIPLDKEYKSFLLSSY